MDPETLFGSALGLTPPWQVRRIEFSTETARLDVYLDFPRGATFHCPACGEAGAKAYDTAEETWRHLNFFQYAAYLHARMPRVQCPGECGIKTVEVAWARPASGFTRLFEALLMVLAREMPVAAIATLLGEHDTLPRGGMIGVKLPESLATFLTVKNPPSFSPESLSENYSQKFTHSLGEEPKKLISKEEQILHHGPERKTYQTWSLQLMKNNRVLGWKRNATNQKRGGQA